MKTSMVYSLALIAGFALLPALSTAPAYAVDTMSASSDAPDLTSVRAKIKANDYAAALSELRELVEDTQHADVYNLLGFTLRKTCSRIPRRAVCRNRQPGKGERTTCSPDQTLSQWL